MGVPVLAENSLQMLRFRFIAVLIDGKASG
jgi:hypothetical protein